jgi:hypothetical protein
MKSKITTGAIFILSLVILGSCRKQVENGNPEFIGYWSGGSINEYGRLYIEIDEDSKAYVYASDPENEHYYHSKGTARADYEKLTIGGTKYYKVIEYPHRIDTNVEKVQIVDHEHYIKKLANWKMVLDGLHGSSHCNVGTHKYYKADY